METINTTTAAAAAENKAITTTTTTTPAATATIPTTSVHVIHELEDNDDNGESTNYIEQLHGMFQKEWWTNQRTMDETRQVVQGSQINVGLVIETEVDVDDKTKKKKRNILVGYGRVLTDYIIKAFLFDIIIHEDYRKNGFGKMLLNEILNHPKLSKVKHFELYCVPEMEPYYKQDQFGFSSDIVKNIVLMRKEREEDTTN